MRVHTLGVELGPVFGEAFESDPLPQQMNELLQGGTSRFVVVHLLLAALACHAVHHPHFTLETQLRREAWSLQWNGVNTHQRYRVEIMSEQPCWHFRENSCWHFKNKHLGLYCSDRGAIFRRNHVDIFRGSAFDDCIREHEYQRACFVLFSFLRSRCVCVCLCMWGSFST